MKRIFLVIDPLSNLIFFFLTILETKLFLSINILSVLNTQFDILNIIEQKKMTLKFKNIFKI